MTSTTTGRRQVSLTRAERIARVWNIVIAANITIAFIIQIWLVLTRSADPNTGQDVSQLSIAKRLVQTFSFFTIQSNVLALASAITLAVNPRRDGKFWRLLRLDALLGITITGLVFDFVLIHYIDPKGWQLVATIGFHYIAPWATVLGWLLFGPFPRIDRTTAAWAFAWPVAWIVYTFVHGGLTGWYPYPFLDVQHIGYAKSFASTGIVLVLAVGLLFGFWTVDRRRRPTVHSSG